jgi:hypothetical protein
MLDDDRPLLLQPLQDCMMDAASVLDASKTSALPFFCTSSALVSYPRCTLDTTFFYLDIRTRIAAQVLHSSYLHSIAITQQQPI